MTAIKRSALLLAALITAGSAAAAPLDCVDDDALLPSPAPFAALYDGAGLSVAQRNRLDALLVVEREALTRLLAAEQRNRQALAQAVDAGADHSSLEYLARREGGFVTDLILLQASARQRAAALLEEPSHPAPIRA